MVTTSHNKPALKTHTILAIIWVIFFLIFTGLCIAHIVEAGKSLPVFELKLEKGTVGSVESFSTGIGAVKKFAVGMRDYVESYNKASQRQNRITAFGYFVASLTALFSMVIEIKNSNSGPD